MEQLQRLRDSRSGLAKQQRALSSARKAHVRESSHALGGLRKWN
jgi:hypothetical protein